MRLASVLRDEKGISIVKLLIGLIVIVIVLYVGVKYVLIRVHYLSIKDTVRVQAESASVYPDEYLTREIVRRAAESKVVLTTDDIIIDRRPGDAVTISLSYTDSLPLYVKTIYFDFDISESAELPR